MQSVIHKLRSPFVSALHSPLAWILFLGTAALGLIGDLWTKSLAVEHLSGGHVVRFLPNWLHFTYIENRGAVFGVGQGKQLLFVTVSFAAIAFLLYLFAVSGTRRFYQVLLGMLLAGVIGNMYDRMTYGHVRDMIHALPGIHWPHFIEKHLPAHLAGHGVFPWIFNVADSLLCVGVFLVLVYSFLYGADPKPQPDPGKPQINESA
jgi:signal peptidase II